MAQWGNDDRANSAPSFVVDASTGRTGIQEYGNTVFGTKSSTPVVGAGSPGWVRVVKSEGRVTGINIISGGTDYDDADIIEVGGDMGTIETDGSGSIISVDITFSGALVDELPVVEVTSDNGAGAEFELVTEGRLGRTSVETLVAMRGIK